MILDRINGENFRRRKITKEKQERKIENYLQYTTVRLAITVHTILVQ